MNPQVKSDRDMASSTMRALFLYLMPDFTHNKEIKDYESVPANAHIVELATVVQIQMILKKKTRCSRF